MKRIFLRTAAALLAAVLIFPLKTAAVSAQKAIVVDADTGYVFYEKRADEKSLIASTTKIMTALLICEQCNVLDMVTVPEEAVGIEGSSLYLRAGEALSVQELLYGLMLESGNDAAVALAIYCGGTVEGFVRKMNDKARMLGLKNTHFVNPHGLDAPEHYSTARDLAILGCYAMQNPIFVQTVSTRAAKAADRYFTNHNKLLWQVDGADGVKTGFTKAAGRILVSSAVRNGRRIVAVTIDDGNDWADHALFYDRCFGEYEDAVLVHRGDILGTAAVFGGECEEVELLAGEDFSYAVLPGDAVTVRLPRKAFAFAPVIKNADAGFAYICLGDRILGRIPLIFAQTVEQMKDS